MTTEATPVAAPAAAEPADKPEPGSHALLVAHARAAQAAHREEQEQREEQVAAAKAEKPAEDEVKPGAKERGADGKFKPAVPAAKVEPKAAAAPAAKAAPVATSVNAISELKELVSQGKIAQALAELGLDEKGLSGKQWEAFHKDVKKDRAAIERGKQEATNAYRQVEQIAGQLEQQFGRYRAAHAAYQAGDYDAAFQQAFGEDLNSFQQKAIQRMATRDPEVARLRQGCHGSS